MTTTTEAEAPTLRLLSLGAGVQSTTLALLACDGTLPGLDAAIFADTGWEPRAVYDHLDRLEAHMADHGIPVHRVQVGNIRQDALDPTHRFASMPLYVLNKDGSPGMGRRQCTSEYKLKPIKRETRRLLGAPPRDDGVPGRVPTGRWSETWLGISADERDRAIGPDGELKAGDVRYARHRYPLLELGWTRADCRRYLARHGWGSTPKSACIGCPYHVNAQWRDLRDNDPEGWADAVDFDAAIRKGNARANAQGQPLRGQMYLHRSRVPLSEAPINHVPSTEWAQRQGDVLEVLAWEEANADQLGGCSPYACASGDAVDGGDDPGTTD